MEGTPVTGLVRSVMEVQSSNPRRWIITVIASARTEHRGLVDTRT
jgi:hypothetical protein